MSVFAFHRAREGDLSEPARGRFVVRLEELTAAEVAKVSFKSAL
jgi:hypothetical protein